MGERLPKHVFDAKVRGDAEALSLSGSAGGRAAAKANAERKHQQLAENELRDEAFSTQQAEQAAKDERARMESANEHILPIDSDA